MIVMVALSFPVVNPAEQGVSRIFPNRSSMVSCRRFPGRVNLFTIGSVAYFRKEYGR